MFKILVIDDDPATRLIIQRSLRDQGYEIILAINGQEGIEKAEAVQPALIICDWMMPLVDGLEVCRYVKANPALSTTFFILLTSLGGVADRVQGLNTGADEFLSKPVEISELQARVQAGLRLHQLNRDLQAQKQKLEAELAEAATYVRSLLPSPLAGEVEIKSCFIPSRQLGGDCFDYFWLDPDYLVMYLLDVSGHGLGAALPSSLILNLIRSQSLPDANFYQPHDVLAALNETFQMNQHNEKYFTIWYGVYNRVKRQLTYASAGHPPAILLTPESATETIQLRTPSLPVGMIPEATFVSDRYQIPVNSTLYIFSDGIYDLEQASHQSWGLNAFVDILINQQDSFNVDRILAQVRSLSGISVFEDDLSLLRVDFG